jgi:hypothetical protein
MKLSRKIVEKAARWAAWQIHSRIYYSGDHFGQTHGKFLDGLSEMCWTYLCGYSVTFALHCANIYWGVPFLSRPEWSGKPKPACDSGCNARLDSGCN